MISLLSLLEHIFSAQLIAIFSEINVISQFSRIKPLKVVVKLVKKSGRIS